MKNTHPIKRYLQENNITAKEFVKRSNLALTPAFISFVMRGKRDMRKRTAIMLSQATGIPKEELMFPEDYN